MTNNDIGPAASKSLLRRTWQSAVASWRRLRRLRHRGRGDPSPPQLPMLLTVEGPNDAEFLRRIGRILHRAHPALPDIGTLEDAGRVIVLPIGGNGPQPWLHELHRLGRAMFHLFDREMPPESEQRRIAVRALNAEPTRRAFLTSKRSLECYLHTEAIHDASGLRVSIGDDDPVAEKVAKSCFVAKGYDQPWPELSLRTRKRLREQAKRWLNREAVDRMTPERLAERDPAGEVRTWLLAVAELVEQSC